MNPWFETICVGIIALSGVFLGRMFSTLRKPYWPLGYFLPFILITMLVIPRVNNALSFLPPFCWIAGRVRCVVLALAVPMGLMTTLSRLPRRYERVAIYILMVMVVVWFSIMPFFVPALIKNRLLNLRTRIDFNGVCLQSSDYTCGPAAAVTALRELGLPADEGQIAVLSHSSPVAGTFPACLNRALQNQYGSAGLECQYRYFDSLGQLKAAGLTLAIVRNKLLSDHCVAVLDVSDQMVLVADPILGRRLISHKQFEKIWRFSGIVLKRKPPESI